MLASEGGKNFQRSPNGQIEPSCLVLGHAVKLNLLLCCDCHFPRFPRSICFFLRVTQLTCDGFQRWGQAPLAS